MNHIADLVTPRPNCHAVIGKLHRRSVFSTKQIFGLPDDSSTNQIKRRYLRCLLRPDPPSNQSKFRVDAWLGQEKIPDQVFHKLADNLVFKRPDDVTRFCMFQTTSAFDRFWAQTVWEEYKSSGVNLRHNKNQHSYWSSIFRRKKTQPDRITAKNNPKGEIGGVIMHYAAHELGHIRRFIIFSRRKSLHDNTLACFSVVDVSNSS